MDFGLGLVLSLTDNATAGLNSAVNTLNQLTQTAEKASSSLDRMASLSALSVVSDRIGNSFTSMGYNIISTLGQVVGEINTTGRTLIYAERQLDALYESSGKTGKEVIGQIQKYAKESMFDFENLIPAVISLKSVGIEAFDAITSSTGNAHYTLLDYASGLASFAPQMRNAYGTGINAAIGAMREYIAEGNAMSLKRGAGLDITGILGEDKGSTIEERTRQVADLIEKLNMISMVDAMKNDPSVKLSNMGDILFQLKGMISDTDIGGLSDSFINIIDIFYDFVMAIDESRLENIAKNIGGALTTVLKPVEWLAKKIVVLADGIVRLVENNPSLTKMMIIGVSLVGVLLILAGIALKVTSAFSGLSLMLLASGNTFKSVGGIFRTGALKMLGTLLPLIAILAMMRFAWKNDIAGIRTNTLYFVNSLTTSFNTARQAVNGNVEDLVNTLEELRNKGDFFSNLTIGIMRFMILFRSLKDAWSDYTLSEDLYLKAKELGILPLIEAILDLKYRFGFFKKGFIEGWQEIGDKVRTFVEGIAKNIKGTIFEKMFNGITKFFQALTDNDPKAWEKAGDIFSKITAGLLGLWTVVKLFKGVSKIFGAGKGIGGLIGGLLGKKSSGGGATGGGLLSNPVQVLKTMGSIAIILGGVALIITALGALTSIPHFSDFISNGADTITKIFNVIIPIAASVGVMAVLLKALDLLKLSPAQALKGLANFAIILGGLELIMVALGAIASVPYFGDFIDTGADVMSKIASVLSTMFSLEVIGSMALISAFGLVPILLVLTGLANLALVLGGITLLITAFGALSKIPGFNEFIESGGDTFALLIKQVGKIAGSLIGGFGEGITNSLPTIGDNLSNFAEKVAPFLDMIRNAPTASTITSFVEAFVGFLAEMIGEKSKSKKLKDVGENISDFSSNLEDMSSVMGDLVTTTTAFSGSFNSMKNNVVTGSALLDTAISNMVSSVSANLDALSAKFSGLKLELPNIKVPHFGISGGFDIESRQVPQVSVDWYQNGGVFNRPSVIGVGEAGTEAVMPLENNIGWIGRLASMITSEMRSIVPTNSDYMSASHNQNSGSSYLTNSNNSSQTIQGDTDNSVVFNEGAIQVTVQNATEEEALRMARMIMEYIKRQKELDRMVKYA